MIQLQNIYKIFNENKPNEKTALCDINLKIEQGELVAIIGKSGAGKSTLLNIMGCLDTPTKGKYLLNGKNVENLKSNKLAEIRNKNLGIITQYPFLIDEVNALDNVLVPIMLSKMKKKNRIEKATQALIDVGLKDLVKQRVSTMSGGEQQRVTIARALVNNPDIILADEPTGSLDTENAKVILSILKNINKFGKTVIIITHDLDIAKQCNRIINLSDGKLSYDKQNTTVAI